MGRTTPLPRPRRPDPSPRSAHRPHRHRRGGHPNLDSLDRLATPPEEITSYTTNPDLTGVRGSRDWCGCWPGLGSSCFLERPRDDEPGDLLTARGDCDRADGKVY